MRLVVLGWYVYFVFYFSEHSHNIGSGELYDKELPLSLVRVRIWDDTCWSPAEISSQGLWLDAGRLSLSECKQQCRQRAECAAVSHGENICFIQTTNGSAAAMHLIHPRVSCRT